ncbi:Retrovirus-related Pol polyprotein from transposon TNT 1-94 [Vitis vinifera]|uniref:Retrovirus-related Pol polyprotein from transposon TNT 1-94 n=1 Tax=Vitis vinifera TaxID=29760 RepID=A0A438G2L4_VITVI|nr:Retrovirus-related Pol polyprotein from transposon TNT 1-94 [Vitis vinifera]
MEESKNSVADIVPIVSKITEHKLNGSNYIEWSKTIKIYLRSVAKDDHLTEEPPNDYTRKLWMQDDARLFLQMKNSINSDIVGLLSHCEFVKELMDYLDFLYSGKGNVSRMYDVWNAFHCPEKGAKSLTAYFMDFKKVYEELNALMPFSPDVRVQQAQREQMAVMSFLSGLPSEFETAKSQILSGENAENARRVNNRGGNRAFENRGNDSSTIVCFYCHEAGHTKKNCRKLQNRNRRIQTANVATSDTATFSDSSNKIVTMTAEEFSKYSQYQDALKASTPVSALAESGSGTVQPTSSITLSSVLNLPNLAFNLISDLMTKRTFGKGHVSDGLYILDEWVPRPVACVSTASPVEAHCRLGHPSLPVLKKLCPQFDTLPSLDCESCHFAKYHRSSLGPRLNKRAESLFELVHSDVWELHESQWGILHQTSCVDTPSQNGVAERKNRHLLETARALMFQMKVPKQFWADAVSTACFLINRMPTVVLKGDIPYKVIHPQKSLFSLAPRIFGCTCYVRDTRPFVTKLDPKALQCVFLGYSRLQKGYRCFSPDLNKYLVSTDVLFSEDTSFFSSPTSSASEEDEEWLVYQVVNSRPTVGQSSVVDSDASLAHSGPVVNIPPAPAKPPIVQVYSRRPVTTDTCPAPAPSSSDPSSDLDLPISLRKGKRHCKSIYSIANFVSYDHLSSSSSVLVASIDSISVPKTVTEALNHPGWKNAMLEEICALEDNHTWKLVDLPQGKKVVGCNCQTQFSSTIYFYCCFPTVDDTSVRHQECFLHGDLEEEVYLEQPPGFVAQGDKEIQAFGMNKSEKDHSVFYKKSAASIILLVVYVDDIVITGNDHAGISDLKTFMHSKFHTKDLGELKYFLGIEVSRSKKGMFLSQRKYVLDCLKRPVSESGWEAELSHRDATRYCICSILYSSQGHTRIECFSDADWAGSKFDRRSTTESEYRAMAQATCEIIWIHQLLCEVGMKCTMPAKLWCDNQALFILLRTQSIMKEPNTLRSIVTSFVKKIEENLVSTGYVKTGEQLGDIFTKL